MMINNDGANDSNIASDAGNDCNAIENPGDAGGGGGEDDDGEDSATDDADDQDDDGFMMEMMMIVEWWLAMMMIVEMIMPTTAMVMTDDGNDYGDDDKVGDVDDGENYDGYANDANELWFDSPFHCEYESSTDADGNHADNDDCDAAHDHGDHVRKTGGLPIANRNEGDCDFVEYIL